VASYNSFALEIIDVSNPTAPVHTGSISHGGSSGALLLSPTSVYVSGNHAYVTSSDSSALEIIDVSNPAAPVHKGSIVDGAGGALLALPKSVCVSGNYAYVTSIITHGLEIIDVSNPAAPVHTGSIDVRDEGGELLGTPNSVHVIGNYAYIASGYPGNALEIVDVSNPANPVHKGSIRDGSGGALLMSPSAAYVSGNYAYITSQGSGALEVVDVTNPAAPVHTSYLLNGDNGAHLTQPTGVFVAGNYAYVASQNTLEIVDVSDPELPPPPSGSAETTINATIQQQLSVAITNPFTGTWMLNPGANSKNYGNLTITANVPWSESTSATNGDYLKISGGTALTNKLQLNSADVTAYTTSGTGSSSTALNFAQQVIMADPAGNYGTVVTFTVNAV
jgi:hypothetical protein